ncbi:tripartite motif-containing protein 10-like [Chrysemys picta bellii]|uniref:tripartite motif-containing protein 10-like n=1 Tax=Chrysemys picta bellii TaxID=8478 RepID=UPI0032B101F0
MASVTPVQEIQEETKCPICLEYLTDPVSIHCGHNFCRGCITQYCGTWTKGDYDPVCCPNCRARIRKGTLRNNYQLANIVEKIKQLDIKPGKENLCERHAKSLDLFCEEDLEAVCVVCERSPEHRTHMVLLMEEAAPKYKKQIEKERQKIVSEFQQLLQFLEEQERLLLAQLEKLDKEIEKIQNENITKLSEEISRLSELISEMEGEYQKPATEFLRC